MESSPRLIMGLPEAALDFLIPLALNLIFVLLVGLVLWPFGKTMLALHLAKGYAILWIVTVITAFALLRIQRLFRIDSYTHLNVYLVTNLSHSLLLLAGWSAFAALIVQSFAAGTFSWMSAIVWLIGVLSSFVAFVVLTTFYRGSVYRVINFLASLGSFLVFAVWLASGRAIFR